MHLLMLNAATLAIALLYAAWKASRCPEKRRHPQLVRERIAYMLWRAAHHDEAPAGAA